VLGGGAWRIGCADDPGVRLCESGYNSVVSKAFTSEETAEPAVVVRPRAPLPAGVPKRQWCRLPAFATIRV
jgi:hypothetical protein